MKIAKFAGERWNKAGRDAAKAEAAGAKSEMQALRQELTTAKADIEKLKKGGKA